MKRNSNKNSNYLIVCLMTYGIFAIFAGTIFSVWAVRFAHSNRMQGIDVSTNSSFHPYMGLVLILFGIAFVFYSFVLDRKRKNELRAEQERAEADRERARMLASDQAELTAEEFLSLADAPEFTGVYILHNETKGMYYVGQSVRVMQRVRQHLTGHGNGDVYADYKYGDRFTVRTISMASSGYLSIDDLERDMIEAYDAYDSGYNRQRGNGR